MRASDRIKDLLDSRGVAYSMIKHPPVKTSREAAAARGTKLEQGAKALVLRSDDGLVMVVLSGADRVDMEKLKNILDVSYVDLADPKDVRKVTGCNIGSVPPFGSLFGLRVFVDKRLLKNREIAFNAGSHTMSIRMKAEDYVNTAGPEIQDLATR